ncbi:MAG: hypothetical protein SWX82_25985 [Cyanobacteriota bacterium]|nr:hypothetical protein [Cyanobacteriota bacterium]
MGEEGRRKKEERRKKKEEGRKKKEEGSSLTIACLLRPTDIVCNVPTLPGFPASVIVKIYIRTYAETLLMVRALAEHAKQNSPTPGPP